MLRKVDKPATTREIYFWNMMGSLSNALSSFVFLMIVSRTLIDKQSDIFSLGFSIAQLMFTVATFQMRIFQATDVKEEFSFGKYFGFRVISSGIMLVVLWTYNLLNGYTGYKAVIIVLLCLYKMIDAISDVFEGLYQQRERLDLAGKFLTLRIIPTVAIFAVVALVSRELLYSCLAALITCMCVMFIYTIRHTGQFLGEKIKLVDFDKKSMWAMFYKVFPIFVNGFILMYIFNVPKNAIDVATVSGKLSDGSQTIYNIIFMPAAVINLLFIFFRPQITKMAIYYADKKFALMMKTARKIGVILVVFTLFVAAAGGTVGVPVLSIIFGKDLSSVRYDLMIVLAGGGISALVSLVDNVLTVYRKQHLNLIGYALSLVLAICVGNNMVNNYGLHGAAITYFMSMLSLLIVLIVICLLVERKVTR